jgi:hypothetical protein
MHIDVQMPMLRLYNFGATGSSGQLDQQSIIQRKDKRFRRCICALLRFGQRALYIILQRVILFNVGDLFAAYFDT